MLSTLQTYLTSPSARSFRCWLHLTSHALEGNVLRVDNSVASEAGRLVHKYSTVPSETDGAVGDQALNELGDNEELHTTLEGDV